MENMETNENRQPVSYEDCQPVNREHKSRLFSFLFGQDGHREWTLSLYNALNGTAHTNPDDIQITTIEDVVYMGMKNDLSYVMSGWNSLYRSLNINEQQSTYNPNMPVREFMYAARLFDKYIKMNRFNAYSTALIPLPVPKLVVFYNGKTEKEDDILLHLSDAFREEIRENILQRYREENKEINPDRIEDEVEAVLQKAQPDIEVTVRMLNINYGHNSSLLASCKPLEEYSWFVKQIQDNSKRMELEPAVDHALRDMPESFEIRPVLMAHKAEVKGMFINEYDEAETMEMFREEGRREGRREGQREGRKEGSDMKLIAQICRKLRKGKTPETIAEELEEDIEVVEAVCKVAERTAPEYDERMIYEDLYTVPV